MGDHFNLNSASNENQTMYCCTYCSKKKQDVDEKNLIKRILKEIDGAVIDNLEPTCTFQDVHPVQSITEHDSASSDSDWDL